MRRRLLIIPAAVVVAVVAAGAVLWTQLGTSTPAGVWAAVEDFRAAAASAAAARPGLPAQGVYEPEVDGHETLKTGPVSVTRDLPTTAPMIVRHQEQGYEIEMRYSEQHVEWSRYRLRPAGAFVIWAQTKVTAAGIGQTRPRDWEPPPLRLPAGYAPGRAWGGRFATGDIELEIRNRLLHTETLAIGGADVEVDVIESAQDVSGEYTGARTETFWYAPSLGLVVRYAIDSSLDGPVDLDVNAEQTLVSLVPRV